VDKQSFLPVSQPAADEVKMGFFERARHRTDRERNRRLAAWAAL